MSGLLAVSLATQVMAAATPGNTGATSKSDDFVRGVNISGAEFGRVSGTLNRDYAYPTDANIGYYQAHGFTIVRLPFKWERMQRALYGDLDVKGNGTGDFERLQAVVASVTGRGMVVILDPHNYGNRVVDGVRYKIGSTAVPAEALEDFWIRLANEYKGNARVWFNLMNEPTGISAADWKSIAQSVTNAIRKTGARNRLLVPGTAYTTAASWVSSGNAKQMESFVDPANNFAFDVHQYLDTDNSGTHGTCVAGAGAKRLNAFTNWATAHGTRGFLGEFAAGDPTIPGQEQCRAELTDLLGHVEANPAQWIGWSAWGAGVRWSPSYIFRLEPTDSAAPDTNLMKALVPYLR
jgi:endoglucanase